MTTGPHDINYQIPDITLGDTFNEWRTVTNDGIIDKLKTRFLNSVKYSVKK